MEVGLKRKTRGKGSLVKKMHKKQFTKEEKGRVRDIYSFSLLVGLNCSPPQLC